MRSQNTGNYTLTWFDKISDIDEGAWDALADRLATPILDWEWLRQMEVSGSMCPATGWTPAHLTVWSGRSLVAAAPLYIKTHSSGEFVYDYAWADVARQLGVRYYPKLVGMSPATPSVGYRFLVAPGLDEEELTEVMLAEIDRFCEQHRLSGCGFNFVDPAWRERLLRRGYASWTHQSYEWRNRGFRTFDDYLSVFNKNQRRNIKRERASMEEQGIVLRALRGEEIPPSYLPIMYQFYDRTNAQFGPWAARFLTKQFFHGLAERFRDRLLFIAAYRERSLERPIGMSFLLAKGDQIVGRYWGSSLDASNLYFNTCYYQPIAWAIENGISSFDPGAGSPLKIRRGFEAVENYSLHRFLDPRMQKVMQTYIGEINQMEQGQIDSMNAGLPFAKGRMTLDSPEGGGMAPPAGAQPHGEGDDDAAE